MLNNSVKKAVIVFNQSWPTVCSTGLQFCSNAVYSHSSSFNLTSHRLNFAMPSQFKDTAAFDYQTQKSFIPFLPD